VIAALYDIHGNLAALEAVLADVDADVVVCGHTHVQFERTIAGKRVINAGSVGSPYEDEPGAYWLLDLEPRRTAYPGAEPAAMSREAWLDWVEAHAVGA
jgi:predicted phosphodiesterase